MDKVIDPAERLRTRQVELILRQLDSLPTLPTVATRLLGLTSSNQGQAQEIISLIRSDQSLTAKILSMANRADSGIRKEARTVEKVVLMLGFDAIRSAVLSIKVFETFGPNSSHQGGLDRVEFWKHCLAVAAASELLARKQRLPIDPEEVFVCGLLHDLGKLAMEQCLPKSYARAVEAANSQFGNIADYERHIIGVDHTILGRRLAQQWRLPAIVEQTIWLHHQPLEAIPEMLAGRKVVGLVGLADTLVREQRFGYSGNFTFINTSAELAEQLGVSPAILRQVVEELPQQVEQRARLLGLGQMTSESLYRSALARANGELGRLYEQLHNRAASLDTQANAFKLLRDFGAQLNGEMTVSGLCQLLASTWTKALGVTAHPTAPVAAYALCSADATLVAAMEAGGDQPAEPILLTCRPDISVAQIPAAISPAELVIPRLVSDPDRLTNWLGPAPLSHRPLICAGRWIGGLLWPASGLPSGLSEEAMDALTVAMAFAADATESRDHSNVLAEQLSQASQRLYAAQRALAEARALAAVGEMAAGAAHEINNPLAVVVGRAELMAESAQGPDRQTWKTIADQAQRISDIVTEMMEFARPPAPQPKPVTARELIDAAREAVKALPEAKGLTLEVKLAPGTPALNVDAGQITRVLAELLKNAAVASGANPRVHVEAQLDEVSQQVTLRVIDQGCGMDVATLANAFTPFFSARPAGRGRGMGLSHARRLVQLAGGKIWIKSAPNQGTTVFVLLPRAEDSAQPGQPGEAKA